MQKLCRELSPAVHLFAHFNHAFIAITAVFCVNNVFLFLEFLIAKFVICSLTSFFFICNIMLTTEYAEIYFISFYFSGTSLQYLGYYIQTRVTTKLLMHFINDVGRKQT